MMKKNKSKKEEKKPLQQFSRTHAVRSMSALQ